MPPFLEQTLQPSDFCFSRHPFVAQIMRSMRGDIGSDTVNDARFKTCDEINELLHQHPSVEARVRLLQKIAQENNNFIMNWRSSKLPRVFLAGTFLRILHDKNISKEDHITLHAITET
jgi:hypothetical protein